MSKLPTDIINIIVEYSVNIFFECKRNNMRKIYTLYDEQFCIICIRRNVIGIHYHLDYTYMKEQLEDNLEEANEIMGKDIFILTALLTAELAEKTKKAIKEHINQYCYSKIISSKKQMYNILFSLKLKFPLVISRDL